MRHAWVSWSSGKDSAAALQAARSDPSLTVTGLLVTTNAEADRVAMHGVRRALVDAQADRLGLPLHVVELPSPCPNEIYEERMAAVMDEAAQAGVGAVVFGDLFLEDVRAYRKRALAATPIEPVFPLWGRPTGTLARDMLASGIRAVLTCVDTAQLPADFVGRDFDDALLDDLPPGVDPCGENGEFHTFVRESPGFSRPIEVHAGEIVTRDQFVFCDLILGP
ncbi:MAG TPA: ATP-binding protein [Acidimicrobiia bacterium]|jgi:uncharacterized protein (TIGR00290 family)